MTELMASLVAARRRRGLSVAAVAERMGVSTDQVSAMERYDADPSLSAVRRYALAVGVTTRTEIVYEEEEP